MCMYVCLSLSLPSSVGQQQQPKGNEGAAQQTLIPVTIKMIADALVAFKSEGLEDLKIDGAEVKNVRTHT